MPDGSSNQDKANDFVPQKTLAEMTTNEKVDWATGLLCLAIGNGTFRAVVAQIILAISHEAYDRGRKDATKQP